MDGLEELHRELGEIKGAQKEHGKTLQAINKSLEMHVANSVKIEALEKARVQHDKRIGDLENTCSTRKPMIDRFESHVEADVPIEHYAGALAIKILLVIGGLAGGWIISRLPKIMELLK